jgi:crotonobetainyl-CoA:carnitine CoA-transferase CaiB-like acyl-CoA transferase
VVDLGRVVAGPFTARILEELGAEVRRVRPPGAFDPPEDVIDLLDPAGADQIAALVSQADLVVENFRPRGWAAVETLIARTPRRRIAIRGFEPDSPLRNWKMYGFLVEGFFGIGTRPCGADGRAEGGAVWDRLCGVVAAAAAVRQLTADTRSAGISQVGLARSWLTAQRAAESFDRDEEQLRR